MMIFYASDGRRAYPATKPILSDCKCCQDTKRVQVKSRHGRMSPAGLWSFLSGSPP